MEPSEQRLRLVVCDAGPLIHLDELDSLDLLSDFDRILVPEAVWSEVKRHRPRALCHPTVPLQRIAPTLPEPPQLEALAQVMTLHLGEWEALRVALETSPDLMLTDDTAARLAAGSLGINTHGTIGILLRAMRRQQRTKPETIAVLRSIPARSTLHLKRTLLDAVIQQVLEYPKL